MNKIKSNPVYPNLNAAISRNGLNYTSLAKEIGLSVDAVSKRMTGKIPFDINEMRQISHVLNETLDYLFGD